ncbi:MAG: hypothetical protein Fur009_5210 [Candidatus Microgenomates bacterium]
MVVILNKKMKINLLDKILIFSALLLYILGYFFGGWSIIINLFILYLIISLIKKSYDDKKITTLYLVFIIIFIVLNILIKIGYFFLLFQNYSLKQQTNKIKKTSVENNPPIDKNYLYSDTFSKSLINEIQEKPKEWEKAVKLKAEKIADDLILICVTYPEEKNQNKNDYCDSVEYWTNNRSGKWEILERYFAGQEGPTTCEIFESWKVAKGMSCYRLSTGETSKVSY